MFVEGAVTEEAYLLYWKRRLREKCLVDIPELHGTPMSLVEKAVEIKKFEEKEDRRGWGNAHDEYWCVFDVDVHPLLPEAMELARRHGVKTAVSNPCIELWFLLHFQDQTAYLERDEAVRLVRSTTGAGKGLTEEALDDLADNFDAARDRAIALDEKHRGDATPFPGNPSSGVWRLVEAMMQG